MSASRSYLIECKRWDEKIGVSEILVLAARGTDIAQAKSGMTVHCILATTAGATRGAVKLAKYFNIEIEIVRSAQEFGIRIGKRVSVGVADHLMLSDKAEATVVRNGVEIP